MKEKDNLGDSVSVPTLGFWLSGRFTAPLSVPSCDICSSCERSVDGGFSLLLFGMLRNQSVFDWNQNVAGPSAKADSSFFHAKRASEALERERTGARWVLFLQAACSRDELGLFKTCTIQVPESPMFGWGHPNFCKIKVERCGIHRASSRIRAVMTTTITAAWKGSRPPPSVSNKRYQFPPPRWFRSIYVSRGSFANVQERQHLTQCEIRRICATHSLNCQNVIPVSIHSINFPMIQKHPSCWSE